MALAEMFAEMRELETANITKVEELKEASEAKLAEEGNVGQAGEEFHCGVIKNYIVAVEEVELGLKNLVKQSDDLQIWWPEIRDKINAGNFAEASKLIEKKLGDISGKPGSWETFKSGLKNVLKQIKQ
ncbi:hypothetical protein N0V91_000852 [Didymella pomorum]|uniref:Uncharacterized protein n=1 Tax=Didymella pomorum TaxID=749634 RepID=A0A9W8ZNS7_9PLEO|nr:hypothetical protein N0V91_000852 [Didymella pomorum]